MYFLLRTDPKTPMTLLINASNGPSHPSSMLNEIVCTVGVVYLSTRASSLMQIAANAKNNEMV